METKTFLMMGRPGSGKYTQSKFLADKLGFEICSSGDWFRNTIASKTFLGRRMQREQDAGYLMPWWVAAFVYENKFFNLEKDDGVVFEGACRTRPEAELFHEICEWLGRPYTVFYLDVKNDEILQRLELRRRTEVRADDSDVEKLNLRISEFEAKTLPSAEFFKSVRHRIDINGQQTPEEVFREMESHVAKLS